MGAVIDNPDEHPHDLPAVRSGALRVRFVDDERMLSNEASLTFGRQADLVVDPVNRSMHRELARFWNVDGQWHLVNLGRAITIVVTDLDGASFARLVPGANIPLPFANTAIAFSAGRANYRITAHQQKSETSTGFPDMPAGYETGLDSTITASRIVFNEDQYLLLSTLGALRANGPIAVDDLPSNRQLAHQLGWTLSKFNRKLDNLCLKLDRAGVTGLVGDTADTARERRLRLANVAVEQHLVELPRRDTAT
jgi:hypothetical protein